MDNLLSVEIRFFPDVASRLAAIADEFREKGHNPYIIPVGSTTPLSVLGYVLAMEELGKQFK